MAVKYIDGKNVTNKRVLLRVDFNVSLRKDSLTIADDERIRQSLPTIKMLLKGKNRLVIISHLGRPKGVDMRFSLRNVAKRLETYLDGYKVKLIEDYLEDQDQQKLVSQKVNEIYLLENIRFYGEEKKNESAFTKKLVKLGEVFVNDAFGVCHRTDSSVVGIPRYLPAFGGLLLKKEVEAISDLMEKPKKPFLAILGGAKISTKIGVIDRLMRSVDQILIGGALANTFFAAEGYSIGKSFAEYENVEVARRLLYLARRHKVELVLPVDVVVGKSEDEDTPGQVYKLDMVPPNKEILDIGPETQAIFGQRIAGAKTIVWNGPVGLFENLQYARGTDFIYYALIQNVKAYTLIGGGDTLASISKKEYLDKLSHISTGGGAMLEYMEKGTLPGIEALDK